jgi:N6-adenosine-specific RNA methylase IME4
MELPNKKYQIIYADPPWKRDRWSEKAQFHSGEKHYQTMSIEELCDIPVETITDKNALLFMWVVGFELDGAIEVMGSWGFQYITIVFNWVKTNQDKSLWMGLGHWSRQGSEICLLGKRGKPKRFAKNIMQVLISPRERHSKKPDVIRNRIVELAGDLPRIELFARQKCEGWDSWGNEIQ